MRTIRIHGPLYFIQAICLISIAFTMVYFFMSQPVVLVSKAVMTHQQEARASVLHYYNPKRTPYLVLVTTMEDTPIMDEIYNNTIRSYSRLMPTIHPILYTTNLTQLSERRQRQAKESGWSISTAPKHIQGLPVIKDMILDAKNREPGATYYGYVSPEMLFDEGLVFTLKEVHRQLTINTTLFAVGREISANIKGVKELYVPNNMRRIAYDILIDLSDDSDLDFFVTSKSFDWTNVPDFVSLVPGAANWLLVWSLINQYQVYDFTNTALAVRQKDNSVSEKDLDAHCISRLHHSLNIAIAGHHKQYPSSLARSDCAPYYTRFTNFVASQKYISSEHRSFVAGCDYSLLDIVKPTDLITVINNNGS